MSRSTIYTCDICDKETDCHSPPRDWTGLHFTGNRTFQLWSNRLDECGKHFCVECTTTLRDHFGFRDWGKKSG